MARMKSIFWLLALSTFEKTSADDLFSLPSPRNLAKAEITKFHVNTKIQMRYAITNIETSVKNNHNEISDVHFNMYIPKEAFVANFSMIIKDKTYVAKVDTKENAKQVFEDSTTTSGIVQSFNDAKFKNGRHVSTHLLSFSRHFKEKNAYETTDECSLVVDDRSIYPILAIAT